MTKTIAVLLSLCIMFGCSKPAPKSLVVSRNEEPYDYTGNEVPSSEENRRPPPKDEEEDRDTPHDNKGFVKWLIGKWQSAWKRPYWSNLWHTSQWDWRHPVSIVGAAVLSYGGYRGVKYVAPKIYDKYDDMRTERAINKIATAQDEAAHINKEMSIFEEIQQSEEEYCEGGLLRDKNGRRFFVYPIHVIGNLDNAIQNLEKVVLKLAPLLPKPYPQAIKSLIKSGAFVDYHNHKFPKLKGNRETLRLRIETAIFKGVEQENFLDRYTTLLREDRIFLNGYLTHPASTMPIVVPDDFEPSCATLARRRDYLYEEINRLLLKIRTELRHIG